MDYELLKKVNEGLTKTNIKGKEYVDVANRIQAFRQMFPEGRIETEILKHENGKLREENKKLKADVQYFEKALQTEEVEYE
jgi:hypothetical protein